MGPCKNHPQIAAAGRCAACAEDLCSSCLVELRSQPYCASCKFMPLEGRVPAIVAAAREGNDMPSPAVKQALTAGIVGFIFGTIGCFYVMGIICGIVALKNGIRAKREQGEFSSRMTRFKTTAGMVLGTLGLLMNILNLAALVMRA